ncbi:germinal-center associated nuclear protein isoform X2 [Hoplias malabaricus]|uniref:germinal-center associated nuclear protein isoform X2 n=1 Tax=Hoplias malabaricus TaxID=27720 RepID=UPI003462428C
MNPSNIFGRQQGAFQIPSNTNQNSGMFQAFSQQGTSSTTPNVSFGQPSNFGQQSVFGQGPGQTSVFGQSPSFSQTPSFTQGVALGQSFSSIAQAPVFGQATLGQGPLGFGAPTGQSQTPAFGQVSTFGQTPAFGQSTSTFGMPSNNSQLSSNTDNTGGSQPKLDQSAFNQPSAFSLPAAISSSSVRGQSNVQTGGFNTKFDFKPPNESVFKPIFSVSPEPSNLKSASAPEPLGFAKPVTGGLSSSGPGSSVFSPFSAVKPSTLGFRFSQPGAPTCVTVTGAQVSQTEAVTGNPLQFTFSQPANPPSCSSTTAVQPTTTPSSPSSFRFSAKVLQPQTEANMLSFSSTAFGQPNLGFRGPKTGQNTDNRSGNEESSEKAAFVSLGKGMKRKEEPTDPSVIQEKNSKVDVSQGGADASRHPSKRPLHRPIGPTGGLFKSALIGLKKSSVPLVKKDDHPVDWGQGVRQEPAVPEAEVLVTPPRAPAPIRHILEKAEKSSPEPESETCTPVRRDQRGASTDSLGGLSPSEATAIQCKGIPPSVNRKDLLEKHFGRFGKVRKVYCRPAKNCATVHFLDHASAAKAKKRGKHFQGSELQIFWNRKKQSPSEKAKRPLLVKEYETTDGEQKPVVSQVTPLRKPLLRTSAADSSLTQGSPIKKPIVANTLQLENEPHQEMCTEGQNMDRPVISLPSSLQSLIGQLAETSEEKYRLLEQRDKMLRQLRPKRTDLDLSKVFVGTCPDMCPEKERYMRETRNQLSIFEVVPETEKVDHYAAVKEYSRSSADQEEPLPHELRPLPVLSMTMDYLVTQIMDQGDGNYRDWYDFVWNRTRGIRKDITQQHLCDPTTVSLIEKCTRFHIHCAHHLCQEPMMSFDAKINNENMTKCLQSLKEMYQDLATKEVHCPHEAEFRQYNVLLKLNDGDILREVQQFRKDVRDSAEVKFAVQAFAALNSNNFVRFFKLVNAASYLACCILHRYFNQVRHSALKALNIAYTVGSQRSTTFPVEDLVRMLMFRNASEATSFLQQYGLSVSEGVVELSRTAYQEPDLHLPQRKSVAIEQKMMVLIGEVVNGGPLPNPPQHTPVCSFDTNNKYRGDMIPLEPLTVMAVPQKQEIKPLMETEPKPVLKSKLQVGLKLFAEPPSAAEVAHPGDTAETGEFSEATVPLIPELMLHPKVQLQPVRSPSPPPKQEPAYTEQDIMAEVDSVVEEVLEAEVTDLAKAVAEYASLALSVSEREVEMVVGEVVSQMLRDLSTAEIMAEKKRTEEEKRKLEEAKRKQEHEAFLDKLSSELFAEISEEVLTRYTKELIGAEIRFALEEKAAFVAHCSEKVCNDLVEDTLDLEIAQLAKEVLDVELRRIHKFIKRWRDVVTVRRQLKRQMRGFPAAPCCVDPRFKIRALAPSAPSTPCLETLAHGLINLGNAGNMAVSCTRLLKTRSDNIHQMRVNFYYNLLLSQRVWKPLDLPTLVAESTPNPPDRIFWKAALLLPSNQDSDMNFANSILTEWLEVKMGGEGKMEESISEMEGKLETLLICNNPRDVGQKTHKVHVCIKVSRGPLNKEGQVHLEDQKELLGTSGLLVMLPLLPGGGHSNIVQDEEDVPLLSALLQLKQVQKASGWNSALPLALIIPGQQEGGLTDQKLEDVLQLRGLVHDGLISEYIFVRISGGISDLQGSQQIGEAVRWLVGHSPASTVLSSQPLLQFVEGGLCREFHARFHNDKLERVQAGLKCQNTAAIIQLYNSVVAYLASVVSSENLIAVSWPPPEFSLPENREHVPHLNWNSPQHLNWLKRAILSLQVPEWYLPRQSASWPRLCASIFQYVSQIPSSPQSQPILMSHLEHLLGKVHAQYMRPDTEEDDDEKAGPSFNNIPWDDVLLLCIEHRMKDWILPETPVTKDAFTEDGEILVYYYKKQLMDFKPPGSWVAAVKHTQREKQQNTDRLICGRNIWRREGDVEFSALHSLANNFHSLSTVFFFACFIFPYKHSLTKDYGFQPLFC